MTAKSHVINTPLLVVHFILSSISPDGSPARFISETMATYLTVDTFRYEEIKFDFTNDGQVDKHDNKMARFVRDVQK